MKVKLEDAVHEVADTTTKLTGASQIFVKDDDKCWLVKIGHISHFEIAGSYTRVFFKEEKPMLYKSLNQVEEK
ncbi:MAG: two-component system LytT family response regulator [Maribacter sp.]